MLQKIWDQISHHQLDEASRSLSVMQTNDEYLEHLTRLLEAEIALQRGHFSESIGRANQVHGYFSNRVPALIDLQQDFAGLGLNCLELCFINWIYTRALVGLKRWQEAQTFAEIAHHQWVFYSFARLPFLKFSSKHLWKDLPEKIQQQLDLIKSALEGVAKPSEDSLPSEKIISRPLHEAILNLLVPEQFTPMSNAPLKTNELSSSEPLVSVCIPCYRDGPWLQWTVDAILANAGYERFEIVIVLQKEHPDDSTGDFLYHSPYHDHPKIKLYLFKHRLGCENAKQISYEKASGELIISLDAHVIPSIDFIAKTVQIFCRYPEVSVLSYGLVETRDDYTLHGYYFNEVPTHLNAMIGTKPIANPSQSLFHKPGLYLRQCLIGTFCITRKLFQEVGGYLLKEHSWGDKSLGMNAFLYGYEIFFSPDILCIHKWHQDRSHRWLENDRCTDHFSYPNTVPADALAVGYFYFSEAYFNQYYLPWIQELSRSNFDYQWKLFEKQLPDIRARKSLFWPKAVRSIREYWLKYWDYIWLNLNENERSHLCRDFNSKS